MREFLGFKRGVNLGGWLSQSNYEKRHLEEFITEKDIGVIASWGADHVRLPFDFNVILDDNFNVRSDAFYYLDKAVEWTKKAGLNIVLDLHKTPGFSFDSGEKETGFFENEKYQKIFLDMWIEIAKHFGKSPENIAFEILNEITDTEYAEPWNKIAKKTIGEIRKYAPETHILIGGVHNNSIFGLTLLEAPFDDKIVYNFHFYDPLIFTHQKAYWVDGMAADFDMSYPDSTEKYIKESSNFFESKFAEVFEAYGEDVVDRRFMEFSMRQAIEIAEKMNVPLYCGEYGVIEVAPLEDTLRWHKDIHDTFEKFGIGRSVWCYKAKDFGFVDEERKAIYSELTKLI